MIPSLDPSFSTGIYRTTAAIRGQAVLVVPAATPRNGGVPTSARDDSGSKCVAFVRPDHRNLNDSIDYATGFSPPHRQLVIIHTVVRNDVLELVEPQRRERGTKCFLPFHRERDGIQNGRRPTVRRSASGGISTTRRTRSGRRGTSRSRSGRRRGRGVVGRRDGRQYRSQPFTERRVAFGFKAHDFRQVTQNPLKVHGHPSSLAITSAVSSSSFSARPWYPHFCFSVRRSPCSAASAY